MADTTTAGDGTQWLRPLPPALPKLARWVPWLVGVGLVSGVVDELNHDGWGRWVSVPLSVVGFVGLAAVGQWLEGRWYAALARRGLWPRVLLGLGSPVVMLVATGLLLGLLGVLGLPQGVTGLRQWVRNGVGFLGLWCASATVGSTVVVLLDTVVSRLVQGFRGRVLAAVLTLLALTSLLNVLVLLAATSLLGVAAGDGAVNLRVDFNELHARGDAAKALLLEHPVWVGLGVFAGVFVLAFPAVVSACLRLADAVVERLEPLSRALRLVGQGRRGVRVEELGSRDFIEVNQRFNEMVGALETSERMERAFGVYVSGHVLERIRAQHGVAAIPASLREASVFFADIRGFTSASERLAPEQVVAFLNRYFARVVAVVDAHDGYLNKFIGDAVVVVFNGPMDQPDHAARAVRCALALQEEIATLNAAHAFPEVGELRVGIGVATGPMVCGNIGASTQMEYTVIGDTVNLSSRLTSHAPAGEVWVNEETARALPEGVEAEPLEPLKVKGKEHPVLPSRVRRARGAVLPA